jgi:hypothetical protein
MQLNNRRIESGEYNHTQATYFDELLNQCEKLADHVIHVNEAIAGNTR